jgi:hypothetical protein
MRMRPAIVGDGGEGDGEDDGATVVKFWEVEEGVFSLGARLMLPHREDWAVPDHASDHAP